MYVCLCHGVTDSAIRAAVEEGAHTFRQLSFATGCGSQCGSCAVTARALLKECLANQTSHDTSPQLRVINVA